MNWLYPLLALGTLTALAVGAYLYVRWRDMKAMREFARRYKAERDREGFPGYRKAEND